MTGLCDSGKTTILYNINQQNIQTQSYPFPGGFLEEFIFNNVKILNWDGQLTYTENYLKLLLKDMKALIYVVDSSDKDTINQSKQYFYKIIDSEYFPKDIPILIISNKIDKENIYSLKEIFEIFEIDALRNKPPFKNINVVQNKYISAEGVQEGLQWLSETLSQ